MSHLRLAPSPWRTDTFRRMSVRLENILGAKTAKQFEPLKISTVGDLVRHLPRRYFSGTELSDLSQLRDGEEVAVMAEVVDARVFNMPSGSYRSGKKPRLEATITDHKGSLTCTFFGQPRLIDYWHGQLHPGARGIFAGKVKEFNRKLQLAHPDFVIVDESGAIIGGAARNAALASASQAAIRRALSDDRQAADLDHRRLRHAGAGITRPGSRTRCRTGSAPKPRSGSWSGRCGRCISPPAGPRSSRAASGCDSTRPSRCN